MAKVSIAVASLVAVSRQAAAQLIAGYQSTSDVFPQLVLDLDQSSVETQLETYTQEGFDYAKSVYGAGGHSLPLANLSLDSPLPTDVEKGAAITGVAVDGSAISGVAYEDAPGGAEKIVVQYVQEDVSDGSAEKSFLVNCRVGGLVASGDENTSGCFAAEGSITIADISAPISYTYDVSADNKNGLTLQSLSTRAESYQNKEYAKAFNYYGEFDYGDQWVLAAFEGTSTNFNSGNADFSKYTFQGREQAIKKGTVYLNLYMSILEHFEDAVASCDVAPWDKGVALYVGSLEGNDGEGSGKFLYALADKRCANFKTCGTNGDSLEGLSQLNSDIMEEFAAGQEVIQSGDCADLNKNVDKIADLMAVPLIQGTLRYAWRIANDGGGEVLSIEAATFAAGVLPRLAACKATDAKIVYDNVGVGATTTDWAAVKNAFERNYPCLNITCAQMGGLWDSDIGAYVQGMEPCDDECFLASTSETTVSADNSTSASADASTLNCPCMDERRRLRKRARVLANGHHSLPRCDGSSSETGSVDKPPVHNDNDRRRRHKVRALEKVGKA